ncbi:MAG: MFS transporter [Nitrospirae bacterium]|nr:MFS transporter [Nitrospirota bacterium]
MNKKILSWCLFDFAGSSYSAIIAAVIFPVYYTNVIVGNASGQGDIWWGRAISLSMALVALSSPFLGGVADYAKIRKKLLFVYTFVCVVSVSFLYFMERGMAMEGFLLVVLANVGKEGGLVFYNSFLPEIAGPERQGRVSSWGFATGYAGSIACLLLAIVLIDKGLLAYVWPMSALFFALFSVPAFLFLTPDATSRLRIAGAAGEGLRNTIAVLKKIWASREQRKLLIAYFIYADGVNTVIVFSSIFAATTLHFSSRELILVFLTVQFTALAGAFLLAKPTDVWGPKKVVVLSLYLWIVISVAAFFVTSKIFFFIIASAAGLGLGTVQSATRAFYAQYIPEGQESEYFGVYALMGKTSAIAGPLIFGYVSSTLGSQRPAVLSVGAFFIVGLILVRKIKGGGPNVSTV